MKVLTVAKALERSQAMEVASKEARNFQLAERDIGSVGQQDQSKQTHLVSKAATQPGSCYRCGNLKHTAMACPHKDKQCNACGRVGHLARVCRSRNSGPQKQKKTKQRSGTTHFVEANDVEEASQSSEEDFFEAGIHSVAGGARYEKLVTSLKLDGTSVKFEVDTGAELSTIPWATYQARLQKTKIHPSSVILHQYDGTVLPIKGEITAQVSLGSQSAIGSFIIVENANSQLPLLGRDWLCKLRLDWRELFRTYKNDDPRIHTLHSATWINEFPEVTKEGLGLLKGIKTTVELEPGAQPKFCKSRPVPFALREQVEETIQQQVEDGELEPVESSDWAAPIVIVRKKDGGVRICADFKMTINPHLCSKTFPLPTPDEVFSTLAQGESFSTLDLARAYKQMKVAPDSQSYLTITTHMGLFRYRRLPFGIATAPAIWQKAMSVVLQGCKGVIYYMDDILVTGQTRTEHEQNLR